MATLVAQAPLMLDPESLVTSTKSVESFRNYEDSDRQDVVSNHYSLMRKFQTLEFAERMAKKYDFSDGKFRSIMTVREAVQKLLTYVDSSDPDAELPNRIHMLQTAEGLRKAGHPDWMQVRITAQCTYLVVSCSVVSCHFVLAVVGRSHP